jgi:hypothetical protein
LALRINGWAKLALTFAFLIASVIGFMLKLPSPFRHSDKELHAAFYFLAAFFLNVLYTNGRLWVHVLLFGALYLFGVVIEHSQSYSNQFFRSRIHGRYDPEDVKYNVMGLVAFSAVWIVYRLGVIVYKQFEVKK